MLTRELKALRALHGHTQKNLADILGIGETSYNKRERGEIEFTIAEAKKIKEIYKLRDEDVIRIFFADEVA